jgi:hypothetical protein
MISVPEPVLGVVPIIPPHADRCNGQVDRQSGHGPLGAAVTEKEIRNDSANRSSFKALAGFGRRRTCGCRQRHRGAAADFPRSISVHQRTTNDFFCAGTAGAASQHTGP